MHRSRVAAVGTQEDMVRLNRVLLSNRDWLEEPEDRPPLTLEELVARVKECTEKEIGGDNTFVYEMVTPAPYGDAIDGTCRYDVRKTASGLYLACFSFDSASRFQTEDWLDLHRRCDRMPMLALHADEDFALEKGQLIFTGGEVQEHWDNMAECWLWLMRQYECGISPEEAVTHLTRLETVMRRDEWEQTIPELLEGAMDNLALAESGETVTAEMLAEKKENRDFDGLFELQCAVAETYLWETERAARWRACLQANLDAWRQAHPEEDGE